MRVCKEKGKMGTGGFAFPEFTLLTKQSTHSDKEASTMSLSLGARPSKNRIIDFERGARGRLACLGTLSPEAHANTGSCSLGTRPSKNQKGGSGKWGRVEVYTAEC